MKLRQLTLAGVKEVAAVKARMNHKGSRNKHNFILLMLFILLFISGWAVSRL